MMIAQSFAAVALLGARLISAQADTLSDASDLVGSSTAIPTSSISSACSTYLTQLNTDTQIQACTEPLVNATRYYSIVSNTTTTTSSPTTDQLDTTLTNLCGTSTGCDTNLIRDQVAQFWDNCHAELQANNDQVVVLYDYLYMLTPLKDSICSTDSSGNYCLKTFAKEAATVSRRSIDENSLSRRATNNSNTAFLFLSPDSDESLLCSDCAKNIMANYISFETSIPYGTGLQNSDKLKVQSDIFKAGKSKCGKSYSSSVNAIAGTTKFAEVGSAAGLKATFGLTFAAAAFVSVALLM